MTGTWNLEEISFLPALQLYHVCGQPVGESSGEEEVDHPEDGLAAAGAGVAGGDGAAGETWGFAFSAGGAQF